MRKYIGLAHLIKYEISPDVQKVGIRQSSVFISQKGKFILKLINIRCVHNILVFSFHNTYDILIVSILRRILYK